MFYNSRPSAIITSTLGTPANPLTSPQPKPKKKRRSIGGWVMVPIALLGFLGLFIGLPYALGGGPNVEVSPGSGFAKIDDRDVVLVPYERTGSVDMWSDMFQLRMAAVELGSGDELWDVQLTDDLALDAKVLTAGKKYGYLTTGKGLLIVDLSDGELVAAKDGIDGLQEDYLDKFTAYGHDPEAKAVIALDRNEKLHTIAIDSLTAKPAGDDIAERWSQRLTAQGFANSGMTNEDEALLEPDKVVRMLNASNGSKFTTMGPGVGVTANVVPLSGQPRELSDKVFYDASFLVDEVGVYNRVPVGVVASPDWGKLLANSVDVGTGTVAGLAADLVMVRHKESAGSDDSIATVMSLKTGEILDSITSTEDIGPAVSRADGTTVFPMGSDPDSYEPDQLAVVDTSGHIDVLDIGHRGLFGGL